MFPGLALAVLHVQIDPAQPLTTAGEELADLQIDDLQIGRYLPSFCLRPFPYFLLFPFLLFIIFFFFFFPSFISLVFPFLFAIFLPSFDYFLLFLTGLFLPSFILSLAFVLFPLAQMPWAFFFCIQPEPDFSYMFEHGLTELFVGAGGANQQEEESMQGDDLQQASLFFFHLGSFFCFFFVFSGWSLCTLCLQALLAFLFACLF